MADVTVGDACEIGIETVPSHRHRGLAAAVTAATVEHYASRQVIATLAGTAKPATRGRLKRPKK
jgi:hypothetical protein